jgi:hypothetical protein
VIKRTVNSPRKRRGPTNRQLAVAALKGAGMGALLAMVFVKFV